jgi:hypothetical protein
MQGRNDAPAVNKIDRMVESAIYLNWKDFSSESSPTAVRLEYQTGPARSLKCLKLWSSVSRGHWKLICEYTTQPSPTQQQGIAFTKTHSSPGFTRLLDAIMQHQAAFFVGGTDLRDRVVLIAAPDEAQCAAAKRDVTEALARITSHGSSGSASMAMRFAADHPAVPAPVSSSRIN